MKLLRGVQKNYRGVRVNLRDVRHHLLGAAERGGIELVHDNHLHARR